MGTPGGALLQYLGDRRLPGKDLLFIACLIGNRPQHGPVRVGQHQVPQAGQRTRRYDGITVEQNQHSAGGNSCAVIVSTCKAAVVTVQDQLDIGMAGHGLLQPGRGIIGGPIVDNDDLRMIIFRIGAQARQTRAGGPFEIIIAQNDDTDRKIHAWFL